MGRRCGDSMGHGEIYFSITEILQTILFTPLFPILSTIQTVLHQYLFPIKTCHIYTTLNPHKNPTLTLSAPSLHEFVRAWHRRRSRWPSVLSRLVPSQGSATSSFPLLPDLVVPGRRWPSSRDRRRSPPDVGGSGRHRAHPDSSPHCSSGGGRPAPTRRYPTSHAA
jgi:hypothetical protein